METVLIIVLAVVAGILALSQLTTMKPTTKADAPPMFHLLPYFARLRVHDNEWVLMYRKGKFRRALAAGTHFLMASGTSIVRLDKRMHECVLNDQDVLTKDHLPFRISIAVEYVVRDPVRLITTLSITDLEQVDDRIYTATEAAIRKVVNDLRMEDAAKDRENLADHLTRALREDVDGWGISIERIGVRDLLIDESVRTSIASTALADREKAAAQKEAEIDAKLAEYAGKEEELAGRETAISTKEEELIHREASLATKERDAASREQDLAGKEASFGEKEKTFSSRDAELVNQKKGLADREAKLTAKEKDLAGRETKLAGKEAKLTRQETDLNTKEAALAAKAESAKSAPKRKTAARKTAAKSGPKTAAKKKSTRAKTAAKTASKSAAPKPQSNGQSSAQEAQKPAESAAKPADSAQPAPAANKGNGAEPPAGTKAADAPNGAKPGSTPAPSSDPSGGPAKN